MSTNVQLFRKLHQQQEPLLLGNVWDAQSARVFEKGQYKAIGTSSAAVAETLGYSDGENMHFAEYLFVIKRIRASTSLPFTVDLEGGYGETAQDVVKNIKQLAELGVAGINIEDSLVKDGLRSILPTEVFADKLEKITRKLRNEHIDIFINVRCDAWLLGLPNAREEATSRMAAYEAAGADGIFLPCITQPEDIRAAVNVSSLPINVMCMPNLPEFSTLQRLGVKRISMGNFVNGSVYKRLEELSSEIAEDGSFATLFNLQTV
jgi:2-methylisocitrate lyase-like PEP mutase family enzyme